MTVWKPKNTRRRQTYYKVQVYDFVSLTWRDEPSAFDELGTASKYIAETLREKQSRIMVVDGKRRFPLKQ